MRIAINNKISDMIPHVIYSTQPQFSGGVYSQIL